MKNLKKVLALLLVFTLIFSMPIFTFAADGESEEVETKYAVLTGDNNGNTTGLLAYDCYGFDGALSLVQGGKGGYQSSDAFVLYKSTSHYSNVLLKIDLSTINSVDYTTKDIQKVELLLSAATSGYAAKTARTFNIADVTSDWDAGDTSYPKYDTTNTESVSHTFVAVAEGETAANKSYPSLVNYAPYSSYSTDLQKYDHSVDITKFVKRNLEKGESVTKLFLYDGNNYYIGRFALFITYKDNNKPSIVVNREQNETTATFNGTISDLDGNEITSATYSVDENDATALTLTEGAYSVNVDTTALDAGDHTFTITATDSLGAVATLNTKFRVVGKLVDTLAAANNGTQVGFLTYEGLNGYSDQTENPDGITAGRNDGYQGNDHYVLNGTKSVVLTKIDLSTINSVDYTKKDVKKVELLISSNKGYESQTLRIANVTSDFNAGDVALPSYDENSLVSTDLTFTQAGEGDTASAGGYVSLASKYGEVATDYDQVVDITDFILNNVNNGENETKLILISPNYYYIKTFMLYITYNDNLKPEISADEPVKDGAVVTFSGNVADEEGDNVVSVKYSVDGGQDEIATFENGSFTFDVNTSSMLKGTHKVVVKAEDEWGALGVKVIEFTKSFDLSVTDGSYTKGDGVYNISATLTNTDGEQVEGYVVYALYSSQNILLAADMESLDSTSTTLNKEVAYSGLDEVSYAKIFVWNSLTNIIPIAGATTAYLAQ